MSFGHLFEHIADVEREPDVLRAAAALFASCSVMSNHHCGHECNVAVQTALDSCIEWTSSLSGDQYATNAAAAETCMKHEQLAKGACDKSSTSSAGGSSSAAACVEPVMRGFYALGLKKFAAPRKAQLSGKATGADKAAANVEDEVDTEVSATLGALTYRSSEDGIPAHIRATAHNIPGSAAASDEEVQNIAQEQRPPGRFSVFGLEIGVVPATVASFAALALVVAALVHTRGRNKTSAELAEAVIHKGERAPLLGAATSSAASAAMSSSSASSRTKLETKKKTSMTYSAI